MAGEEEGDERRNNIILRGEEIIGKGTPQETVRHVLKEDVNIEADVEEAYWIRKRQKGSILLAKLRNWQQKEEVMLKKNQMKGKKLYIDNGLTKKERDV